MSLALYSSRVRSNEVRRQSADGIAVGGLDAARNALGVTHEKHWVTYGLATASKALHRGKSVLNIDPEGEPGPEGKKRSRGIGSPGNDAGIEQEESRASYEPSNPNPEEVVPPSLDLFPEHD